MRYPVLVFKKSRIVGYNSMEQLMFTTKQAVIEGEYRGIEIIDSHGIHFSILDAEIKRTVGFLGGYDIFFNKNVEITFNIDKTDTISLHAFKAKVIGCIYSDTEYWEASENIELLVEQVSNCDSHLTVISRLTY